SVSLLSSALFCSWFLSARPPLPAVFPYSPLFRSVRWGRAGGRDLRVSLECDALDGDHRQGIGDAPVEDHRDGRREGHPCHRQVRDRKSTRLNSSHVKISYAVFCLKKKKKHVTELI